MDKFLEKFYEKLNKKYFKNSEKIIVLEKINSKIKVFKIKKSGNKKIIIILNYLEKNIWEKIKNYGWIKYISSDNSGDYNCDWKSDQIVINTALDFIVWNNNFNRVHLKKWTICVIDEPILMWNNTIFSGDKSAVIQLKDNVGWWKKAKPMISQKNKKWYDSWWKPWDSISNVEIFGFEIHWWEQKEPTWKEFIPIIHFYYPKNIIIHDMLFLRSKWDIIRLSSAGVNGKPYETN